MVGVKMTQTDKVEVPEVGAGFAESKKSTAAGIDQYARMAIYPDKIG